MYVGGHPEPLPQAEWNACIDPQSMLEFLRVEASERKLRLFAVACCRRIWALFDKERHRRAVEVAEKYADGLANERELEFAKDGTGWWRKPAETTHSSGKVLHRTVMETASYVAGGNIRKAAPDVAKTTAWIVGRVASDAVPPRTIQTAETVRVAKASVQESQCNLLRCMFGPLPFRPLAFDSAWFSPTVAELAEAIYEERAFERLPILADALEDAGCSHPDILAHCRQPAAHARGCWCLDLLLGKE